MAEKPEDTLRHSKGSLSARLKHLAMPQLRMIDDAISEIGDFGEVQLIIKQGCLRFLVTKKSHDALKYHPGTLSRH